MIKGNIIVFCDHLISGKPLCHLSISSVRQTFFSMPSPLPSQPESFSSSQLGHRQIILRFTISHFQHVSCHSQKLQSPEVFHWWFTILCLAFSLITISLLIINHNLVGDLLSQLLQSSDRELANNRLTQELLLSKGKTILGLIYLCLLANFNPHHPDQQISFSSQFHTVEMF